MTKALDFVIRKKMMIGRSKKKKLSDGLGQLKFSICRGLDISPLKVCSSSYSDAKSRRFISENSKFKKVKPINIQEQLSETEQGSKDGDGSASPTNSIIEDAHNIRDSVSENFTLDGLPKAKLNEKITAEHAYISLQEIITAHLTFIFTTPVLHAHFYWFLDTATFLPQEKKLIYGIYMDGFPLFKEVSAFLSCIVCANLPATLQMPDFHVVNSLLKDGENSQNAWVIIRDVEAAARDLEENGLMLKFSGYDDNLCLPKTSLKLNGEHKFRFQFFGKGDTKMKNQLNGSVSSNMTYPAAEVPWDIEQLGYPPNEISADIVRSYLEKLDLFDALQLKRKSLDDSFTKAKILLENNKKLSKQQKSKQLEKILAKFQRDLNAEAAKLKSCFIHERPVEFSHWFPPCLLHFSCNEWARFIKSIEVYASRLTLSLGLHDGVLYRKNGPSSFESIPNLLKCPNHAPIAQLIGTLRESGLAPTAKFLTKRYSFDESPMSKISTNDTEETTGKKKRHPRLIGEHVKKLERKLPSILQSVQPLQFGVLENDSDNL